MALNYYIIDTETTGLRSDYHEMTEISIIRSSDRNQLFKQIKCQYPNRANLSALKITNKSMKDLYEGDDKKYVVNECNKFFEQDNSSPQARVIVGHNIISFDKRFLFALWESCNSTFPANLWLDTMHLMKTLLNKKGIKDRKIGLHNCCDMLNLQKIAKAHSAKTDSRNNYYLFKELTENQNIDILSHIKTFPHLTLSSETIENNPEEIFEDF